MARKILRSSLNIDEKDPEPVAATAEQLHEYEGHYTSSRAHLILTVQDGRLVVEDVPQGGFPTPDSPPGPAAPVMRPPYRPGIG